MSDVDLIAGRESWTDGQYRIQFQERLTRKWDYLGNSDAAIPSNYVGYSHLKVVSKGFRSLNDMHGWNSRLRNCAWIQIWVGVSANIPLGDDRHTEESMSIEELLIFVLMWFTRHIWVRLPLCRWKSTAMCWYIQIHILGESSDSIFWNELLCLIIGILRKGVTKLATGVT